MNGHCLRLFQENRRQPVENDEEWHSGGGCVETPALTRRVSAIFGRHHSQPTITHSYGIANIEYTPNASSRDFGKPALPKSCLLGQCHFLGMLWGFYFMHPCPSPERIEEGREISKC